MSRKALEIWKEYIDYIYGLCFKFSQFLFESLCVVFFYVKSGGLFKRFITTEPGGGSGFFDTLTFSKRASRSQKHVKTHVHSCAPTTWQYYYWYFINKKKSFSVKSPYRSKGSKVKYLYWIYLCWWIWRNKYLCKIWLETLTVSVFQRISIPTYV